MLGDKLFSRGDCRGNDLTQSVETLLVVGYSMAELVWNPSWIIHVTGDGWRRRWILGDDRSWGGWECRRPPVAARTPVEPAISAIAVNVARWRRNIRSSLQLMGVPTWQGR